MLLSFWLLIPAVFLIGSIKADVHERRLLSDLLEHYSRYERPVIEHEEAVTLYMGMSLFQLLDVVWVDVNLDWEPLEYGNITQLCLPIKRIWHPDILLYNSVDTQFDRLQKVNAQLYANGTIVWSPPAVLRSGCNIDVTYFPFDDQHCHFKFGSWSYNKNKLDLLLSSKLVEVSDYKDSGEWKLLKAVAERNENNYSCCPHEFVDITYRVSIRRRTLFWGVNIILPSLISSLMVILVFTLPSETGEKVALDITVFLSLWFCLQMLADISPPTSTSLPLLAMFFLCCNVLVALSTVFSVIILNIHHSEPDTAEMSEIERLIFVVWLPKLVRLSRASNRKKIEQKTLSAITNGTMVCDQCPGDILPPCTCDKIDDRSISGILFSKNPPRKLFGSGIALQIVSGLGRCIRGELQGVTTILSKSDREDLQRNDWRFAARAIDRLCLYLFFGLITTFTGAIMFSAPYIVA